MRQCLKNNKKQEETFRILYEEIEKRDAHTKYFVTENHGGIAAVYPEAVHYQEDGVWKEIDNRLKPNDDGEGDFCNQAGAVKIRFAKHSTSKKLVTIQKENQKLSWAFLPAREKDTVERKFSVIESDERGEVEKNEKKMLINHMGSGGRYEEIIPGVDLFYFLRGETLKEEIILKNTTAASSKLVFSIEHKKLCANLEKDGAIQFTQPDQEEVFFRLSAPCMYDAAGNYSGDIYYELETDGEGSILTIVIDTKWLLDSERVYPIVIDPNTETNKNSKDIEDTFVREKQPFSSVVSTYGSFYVGNTSNEGRCRAFLKFNNLPTIPNGSIIYDARIYVWQYKYSSYGEKSFYVTAHKVNGSWSAGSTTWNNQPSYDPIVQDYAKIEEVQNGNIVSITPRCFNLTKLVRDWYNTGVNNGIMLKMQSETSRSVGIFVTSDYPAGSAYGITSNQYPSGVFYYRDANGLEDYYSYHTHSVGRAGNGAVNDFNGNLVFTHMDVATQGNRFPVQLNHVYNLALENEWCRVGYGWRLSAHQELRASGITDFPYVYTDEDGTRHYFYKDTEDGNKLKDEDGLGLVITAESSSSSEEYRTMETKDKVQLIFGQDGYLRKEKDPNGNTITYTYTSDSFGPYLTKITDASGASVALEYEYTKLVRIRDDAGRVTSFQYDPWNNLINVIYPDGKVTTFLFDNHELIGVKAPDGYEVDYSYVDDFRVKRISKITEKSGNSIGQELKVSYKNGNTTIFEECGFDGELENTEDNKIYTYQFDDSGRPVCISDQKGNAESFDYFKTGQKNNKLSKLGSTQKTIYNYMKNPRFENGMENWGLYSQEASYVQICKNKGYIGVCSVKAQRPTVDEGASGVYQLVNLEPGIYTLSAYICTENVAAGGKAHLAVVGICKDGNSENLALSSGIGGMTDAQVDRGWVRETVTFTVNSNHTAVSAIGALFNTSGTAWFTCFQIEKGMVANKFNLLENGSFEQSGTAANIPFAFNGQETGSNDGRINGKGKFDSYALHISGEIGKRKGYSQTISIKTDESMVFSVSGWVKANAIPGKEFALVVGFAYEDGGFRFEDIPFNPNITDWQFVHKTVSPNDNLAHTKRTIGCITLYAFFSDNQNDAYFDGFQITCEDTESYVYDEKGNMISAVSVAEKTGFSYDKGHSLSRMTDITGTGFSYGYDNKKNLRLVDNSEGVCYRFHYDTNGNPVETVMQGGSHKGTVTSGRMYAIREKVSGKYLTVRNKGTTSGNLCELWEYDGSMTQKWKVFDAGEGYLQLIPQNMDGMSLDAAGSENRDAVSATICTINYSDTQKFKIRMMEDGSFQILSKCSKDQRGLTNASNSTDNGTAVTVWGTDDSYERQHWYFEPVDLENTSDKPEAGEIYEIRINHSGQYLTIPEENSQTGIGIEQKYYKCDKSQQFLLEESSDGYYYLRSVSSRNMVLAQSGIYEGYPALTLQKEDLADDSQKFYFQKMGRGYGIGCKKNRKYMDVYYFGYTPGTRVIFADGLNETNINRIFILEKCSLQIESSMEYTEDGRNIYKIMDSRGTETVNGYDSKNRLLTSVTDGRGYVTQYGYDEATDQLISVAATVNGQEVKNTYTYDAGDRLKTIDHNGFQYSYEYDVFGNQTAVRVGGTLLESRAYFPHNGPLKTVTYGNGKIMENLYDKEFRLTKQKYNGQTISENQYDDSGNLLLHRDITNSVNYYYDYDLIGRMKAMDTAHGQSLRIVYDEKNRVESIVQKAGGSGYQVSYLYGEATNGQKPGLLYGLKVDGTQRQTLEYDFLSRIRARKWNLNVGKTYESSYTFVPGKNSGTTTTLVKSLKNGNTTLSYTYDEVGNIKSISENGTEKVRYQYDELSQLIREDSVWENKTVCYTYDLGGNLTARKEYAYTTGKPGAVQKEHTYTYRSSGWKDQLIIYDEQPITYDGMGNPLQYRGMECGWQRGKELAYLKRNGVTNSYAYDSGGNRVRKIVGNVITQYYLDGSTIVGMKQGSEMIHFIYDGDGNLFAMKLGEGSIYYYLHNPQNDVVGLIDSDGEQVVSYRYDSWGKQTGLTDTSGNRIGEKNPFRYREYCYDAETELYYLGSRYYDPEIGRFINADDADVLEVQYNLHDKNLYAYCDNNPISRVDEEGNLWGLALTGGGTVAVGSGFSLGASIMTALGTITPMGWAVIGGIAVGTAAGILYSKAKSRYKKEKTKKKGEIESEVQKPRKKESLGKRSRNSTRKAAKQKAERELRRKNRKKIGKKEVIRNERHPNSPNTSPHFHPGESHNHYYYPKRFY